MQDEIQDRLSLRPREYQVPHYRPEYAKEETIEYSGREACVPVEPNGDGNEMIVGTENRTNGGLVRFTFFGRSDVSDILEGCNTGVDNKAIRSPRSPAAFSQLGT